MKLNRMSEENKAPEWAFGKTTDEFFDKHAVDNKELERLSNLSQKISDDEVVKEKNRIEQCANSKKPYHYNSEWSNNVKQELKEYAEVCGMNMSKFKSVDLSKVNVANNTSNPVKSSSDNGITVDAFKIDEKAAKAYEKSKWKEEITKASKLDDKPSMSGIVPVRGGEDYYANSESKTARGQNSITDPNAIGKLAENSQEDTGARLKREKIEKENAKKSNHEQWQQEKVASMEGKEILPNRRVFPTETMNAQPGIKGDVFDFSKVPDKTVGENIKQANKERKEQIKGKEKAKYEFALCKNPTRTISDTFSDELKKHMGKA